MKMWLSILLVMLSFQVCAQASPDPVVQLLEENAFFTVQQDLNNKLLLFLHGGVRNPYFDQAVEDVDFDFLIEGNTSFVDQALTNGFDLLAPIVNERLNWLLKPESASVILQDLIKSLGKGYDEIYISGFSDGGTGSYKVFYQDSKLFDGLVVFNGYPQHSRFNETVDYSEVSEQPVLFFATNKDKTIPYEFLLAAYCDQKEINPLTFFYLASGGHSFGSYTEKDIAEMFDILIGNNVSTSKDPIQGFLKNDSLVARYPFRKKILKKYGFGAEVYKANILQHESGK